MSFLTVNTLNVEDVISLLGVGINSFHPYLNIKFSKVFICSYIVFERFLGQKWDIHILYGLKKVFGTK